MKLVPNLIAPRCFCPSMDATTERPYVIVGVRCCAALRVIIEMRYYQKVERLSFENPSILDYVHRHIRKAGRLHDHGIERNVLSVDSYRSIGYCCPIQKRRDVKKADSRRNPLFLDNGSANYHCFRYATTEPGTSWNIMDVIKPYRRSALRLRLYSLSLPSPVKPLQPVFSCGRDPPAD